MDDLFQGVCPVINVPFTEVFEIDFPGIDRIVAHVLESGCKSVCLFAFNSEPHKMTHEEKKAVIRHFLKVVDRRMETVIGLIDNSLQDIIDLGLTAKEYNADGIILYPPSVACPAADGLIAYFKEIADAVDLPVMLQDNPRSTGIQMSTDLLLEICRQIPRFRYLKVECTFPTKKIRQICAATNGAMKCYSGNGGIYTMDAHLCGAWGIMPGVAICGKFVELYDLLYAGKIEQARDLFEKLLPLTWYEDQSLEFYIACEKELLALQGVTDNALVRRPGVALSDSQREELLTLYHRAIR